MKKLDPENLEHLPHPIYDSHAHLAEESFDEILDDVIHRARETDVCGVIVPSDTIEASRAAVNLCLKYPDFMKAAVGLHPYDARFYTKDVESELTNLAKENCVCAIGETGLDFRPDGNDESPRDVQKESFEKQMHLALKLDMPIIIHCRNAYDELVSILSSSEYENLRGVVHCFSGSPEHAEFLVKKGWHIGFTGNVTFKNAPEIREAAEAVPLERILIETDCPYMTPHPFRGVRPNEPIYVRLMAKAIADCHDVTLEKICRETWNNTRRIFELE